MASVESSIDVNVPVSTAYNQWTQFEEFPEFMEGVEYVTQIDDTHLRWAAEITEQTPDQRVAWTARGGKQNAGVVSFHRIDDMTTRVTLQMDWEPEGMKEKAGSMLGRDEAQVKGDLERFKEFIERRGVETGAWRGEVSGGTTT
jgi:uncharacterized membrane protein